MAKGYASENRIITIEANLSTVAPIRLRANLAGILHKESIILDAALGSNETGDSFNNNLNAAFARLPNARAILKQNTAVPEVNLTNKTAVEVIIKCRTPMLAARDLPALLEGIINFKRTAGQEREE